MKTRSEVLRQLADSWQCNCDDYTAEVHRDLADLLDATTPRPWPPPEGVERCLAWRDKQDGWFVIYRETHPVTEELQWWADGVIAVNRRPPKFWLPMPPDPEESK